MGESDFDELVGMRDKFLEGAQEQVARNAWDRVLKSNVRPPTDRQVNYLTRLVGGLIYTARVHKWERVSSWIQDLDMPASAEEVSIKIDAIQKVITFEQKHYHYWGVDETEAEVKVMDFLMERFNKAEGS